MLDRILFYAFAALFFLTPLFWLPSNYELFEFNKMLVVYFLTILITGTWVVKSIKNKSFNLKNTPLTIPLLLFLAANILSAVFSIDKHISIWGYYSRSNGGLLSTISYILLFFALVANFDKQKILRLLKIGFFGGVLVSLWAVPEHFGVSPSCVILRGELRADCWIQDVQARVFATLGQPNWLAAYLGMLIFPGIYFFLTEQRQKWRIIYFISLVLMYMAFTFTYSRGAALGLVAGFVIFAVYVFGRGEIFENVSSRVTKRPNNSLDKSEENSFGQSFILIVAAFLIVNVIYGSALVRFKLTAFLPKSNNVQVQKATPGQVTQLENGGTESGQIRLIVWQGALDIFKSYPIFGSGVETFAYSYYKFRPAAHNLVSEWDFLYNKAHNEFLNYLATTGIIGFSTYMLVILTFIFWCLRKIMNDLAIKNSKLEIKNGETLQSLRNDKLFIAVILSSYASYLVQNFFGFSVVIIAVFFYLFPAMAFVVNHDVKPLKIPSIPLLSLVYYRDIYSKSVSILVILATIFMLYQVVNFWRADSLFAQGDRASEVGNPGRAYNYLTDAVNLRGFDPLYRSELGYAAASAALALEETDASLSAELVTQADKETDLALMISPNNLSFWRTAVRTYFSLSLMDGAFNDKLLNAVNTTINLAPTDPKLYYNKAVILEQLERWDEAETALKKSIELKPNYREGYLNLALFYHDRKDYDKALENMKTVLTLVPRDPEVLSYLDKWGAEEGIATQSAIPEGQ